MNRRIKYMSLAATLLGLFAATEAGAQLNKEVEVTKDYRPTVGAATKLSIKPDMVDTVSLRPEISYSITSTTWNTSFDTRPYAPASVVVAPYSVHVPYYLKVGAGYPLNSVLDFYATSVNDRNGFSGAYVNHRGEYSGIENDLGVTRNALGMENRLGGFVNQRFQAGRNGHEMGVGVALDLSNRIATCYGAFAMPELPLESYAPDKDARIMYNGAGLRVSVGHDFKDLSYFNFRMSAEGGYDFATDKYNQFRAGGLVELGKSWRAHGFTLGLGASTIGGVGSLDDYSSSTFLLQPRYMISTGKFHMKMGVDIAANNNSWHEAMGLKDMQTSLFPVFDMTVDATRGYFVPFVRLGGGLRTNDYFSLNRRNPYIVSGLTAPDTQEYDLRGGITGSASTTFSYRLYAGMSLMKNYLFMTNLYEDGNTARFGGIVDRLTMFTAGGELDFIFGRDFHLTADMQYCAYKTRYVVRAADLPGLTASLRLGYYGDKFSFSLGGKYIGRRDFLVSTAGAAPHPDDDGIVDEPAALRPLVFASAGMNHPAVERSKAAVDLSLDVDIRLSRSMLLFLEGHNLANARLYPYNHYRGFGVSGTAGIKLTF